MQPHPGAVSGPSLLAAALALALAACGEAHAPPPAAAPLASAQVVVALGDKRPHPVVEEVVGTLRARTRATIAPILGGKVVGLEVTVGSKVKAGDLLVRISAREVEARLEQASAVLALARLERDRAAALRAQDAIPSSQLDSALSQLRVAEAGVAEARTLASHAVLRAPFDGVVTAKMVNAGDTALPGQPLLVLEAPHVLRFEARVPEAAARGLAIGQPALVRLDGTAGERRGTIGEIDPASDPESRTVLIKVDLDPDPALQSGRFGRLLLTTSTSPAITVPAGAIVRRGQLESVFVVDGGAARLRLVRAGREREGRVEVVSGLEGGETVAVAGAAALVDGQPVEVRK